MDVYLIIVIVGTFALLMAFASRYLVNFTGVPLVGLNSYQKIFAAPGAYHGQLLVGSNQLNQVKSG